MPIPNMKWEMLSRERHMRITVGTLKEKLADLPDDTVVVLNGSDHSYIPAWAAKLVHAEEHSGGEYSEFYGQEHLRKDSKVSSVFLVGE